MSETLTVEQVIAQLRNWASERRYVSEFGGPAAQGETAGQAQLLSTAADLLVLARLPFPDGGTLIEPLADYAHEAWAGWMRHLFKLSVANVDGSVTIPPYYVARWQRQSSTSYANLPPEEQSSDRKEAARMLAIMRLARAGSSHD